MSDTVKLTCPFCCHKVEAPKSWIKENGRVYCDTCCKAFDVESTEAEDKNGFMLPDFWD